MNKPKFKPWVELRPAETKDAIFCVDSLRYSIPNGGGLPYLSDSTRIVVTNERQIYFSDNDGGDVVFFYEDQIPHLKKAISAWNKRVGRKP